MHARLTAGIRKSCRQIKSGVGVFFSLFIFSFVHEGQHTSLLKMMELCQTSTPPPPHPLAAAYTLVVYDDNFCPPFLPAISNDDVTSIVLNKQVFRPIPTRPIVRNEINNYPSHVGVFDKQQVLFRPIPIDDEV